MQTSSVKEDRERIQGRSTMPASECVNTRGVNVQKKKEENNGIDPQLIAATTIIGDKVIGSDNKEVGKIEEIMMDLTEGTLTYVVLSIGGVLGIGDRFIALPLDSLTFDTEEKVFYIDANSQKLKKLPGFDKNQWPRKAEWPVVR
jgi:sporulation protein YlmC with PRC-barrel domain